MADFLHNFISNNIRLKTTAKNKTKQLVRLVFYEFECWKCHEMNHRYYIDTPFYSACNAKIDPNEALWDSHAMEYRPEIIQIAQSYVESSQARSNGWTKRNNLRGRNYAKREDRDAN